VHEQGASRGKHSRAQAPVGSIKRVGQVDCGSRQNGVVKNAPNDVSHDGAPNGNSTRGLWLLSNAIDDFHGTQTMQRFNYLRGKTPAVMHYRIMQIVN
jgi:hypothetical protein